MKKILVVVMMCSLAIASTARVSATDWPQFADGPAHNSYVPDSGIGSGNAASFGVKWMAHLFSGDLGSPVVAYNAALAKEVVYVGSEHGDVFAVDASNGQQIWSINLGAGNAERDTPAVGSDGSVWIGTNYAPSLYRLDGATGRVTCRVSSPNGKAVQGSPMIVKPKGGVETVYWDTLDGGVNGPLVATNAATCQQIFQDTVVGGSWTTPSYAVNGAGEPLVIVGTADPTCDEVAYDANTGAQVWKAFLAIYNPCTADVGNAGAISAPGNNGFVNGVDYVADDDGTEFALDLNSGKTLWKYDSYPTGFAGKMYQISSMALDGKTVVYGYYNGVNALNAVTGALQWSWTAPAGVDTSPAIIGSPGSEVVAATDISGGFRLFSLASGAQLYTYQSSGYFVASPAVYNGTVFITNGNGYLYAFGPNGGNTAPPTQAVSSPANGAKLANPNGTLTISGTATDASSVSSVEVAVQENGSSGSWYNASTNSWQPAPFRNAATLASPGASTSNWSFQLRIPASGNTYEVFVNAGNASGIFGSAATSSFTVAPSLSAPTIHTSSFDVAPGASITATGNAFEPGETASFTLFGKVVGTATVGTTGNVPQTTIQVPTNVPFGPTSLTVTGNTTKKSATTEIYVANAWTQFGYGASRTGMEPFDFVINHTEFAGPSVLSVDWNYSTGAAINTTPAIEDGVAYVGNDAGTLTAITVSSGTKVWSYTVPSGQPIRSSPALDAQKNLVFGANDGTLYIVSSGGTLVHTVALAGTLQSPAYDNGNIFITNAAGQVWSIADPAWTTNWTTNAGSQITTPIAVDSLQGLAFIGTASGQVIAVGSASGVTKWSATTGGQINGLAIVGGQIFAGSADGHVYMYNERTGAVNYTLSGDGSAVTSLDANGGGPAWGTAKGGLYEATSKGNVYYNRSYATSPVIGIAGAGTDEFGAYAIGNLGMLRAADGSWFWQSGAKYTVGPVVLDGVLFQGAQNGNFVSFVPTNYQIPPQASVRAGSALITVDGTGCSSAP